ncbi:MAG: hypothetical protein U0401_32750 [Anaerolineae bacterium]
MSRLAQQGRGHSDDLVRTAQPAGMSDRVIVMRLRPHHWRA